MVLLVDFYEFFLEVVYTIEFGTNLRKLFEKPILGSACTDWPQKKYARQVGYKDINNLDSTAQMLNSYAVANISFQTFNCFPTDVPHMLNAIFVGQFSKISNHREHST